MTKVAKVTWVLQRIEQGHYIDWHNDEAKGRLISFIYYLTPDDWNYKVDGGPLKIMQDFYKKIIQHLIH
jgi:hypothetical protein